MLGASVYGYSREKEPCDSCRRTGWLGSLAERCLTNNPRRVADIGGTVIYETTEWQDGWLIPAEWSRGFVHSVRVTLDQLTREWGRIPCPECAKRSGMACGTCANSGCVPVSWAAHLFREWPVERVVVTLPDPQTYQGDWPAGILEHLNDWDTGVEGAADTAISDAVCRWGRAEAAWLDDQERQ